MLCSRARGTGSATIEGVKRIFLGLLFLVGCGRDPGDVDSYIGATCSTDRDCDERCYLGGNFPGGFCSITCRSDNDCPSDTVCIDHEGGVCMFLCSEFDCARLGRGWACHDEDRVSGGKDIVCSGG